MCVELTWMACGFHLGRRIERLTFIRTPVRNCVMEWVRVWLVTTRRDDAASKVDQVVRTAGELRTVLAEARGDPAVWHVRYTSRRELAGEKPTHCVCGADYRTAGSGATPHEWLDCRCGGAPLVGLCVRCGAGRAGGGV